MEDQRKIDKIARYNNIAGAIIKTLSFMLLGFICKFIWDARDQIKDNIYIIRENSENIVKINRDILQLEKQVYDMKEKVLKLQIQFTYVEQDLINMKVEHTDILKIYKKAWRHDR